MRYDCVSSCQFSVCMVTRLAALKKSTDKYLSQHRKTTCLLSIRKSHACARASKLTTNIYIARARCESQSAVKPSGLNATSWHGRTVEFKSFAWSPIAQSVCGWAFSLLAIWCLRLPSFESCIQQRKAICLVSIKKMISSDRASKWTKTNSGKEIDWQIHESDLIKGRRVENIWISDIK